MSVNAHSRMTYGFAKHLASPEEASEPALLPGAILLVGDQETRLLVENEALPPKF